MLGTNFGNAQAELYASITNIAAEAPDSPIRLGAIAAYSHVMKNLVRSFPASLVESQRS